MAAAVAAMLFGATSLLIGVLFAVRRREARAELAR
jgi:hypothetical protein